MTETGDGPRPGDADPREELGRLLAEIGRMGEDAAARVVERFAGIARTVLDDDNATGDRPDAGLADADLVAALRRARVETERSLDDAAAAVGRSLDATSTLVEEALRRVGPTPDGAADDPVVVSLGADGVGQAPMWLHNSTTAATGSIVVSIGELRRVDGEALSAKVEVRPATVGPIPPGGSRELRCDVVAAPGTAAGRYHGLVLGGPDPEVTLHLVVDVATEVADGGGEP